MMGTGQTGSWGTKGLYNMELAWEYSGVAMGGFGAENLGVQMDTFGWGGLGKQGGTLGRGSKGGNGELWVRVGGSHRRISAEGLRGSGLGMT